MDLAEIIIALYIQKYIIMYTNQAYIRHYFTYHGWFTCSQRLFLFGFPETRRFYYYQYNYKITCYMSIVVSILII